MEIPEPSSDQCTAQERFTLPDGRPALALWYPQMGGYSGKAVAVYDNSCCDLYVWHDGEFPFSGDDSDLRPDKPVEVHHCDPEQFIGFGRTLAAFGEEVDHGEDTDG